LHTNFAIWGSSITPPPPTSDLNIILSLHRSFAAPAQAHAAAQTDASAYRSKQGGSFEEALDINVVDVEDLFNPASGYWENPANWNDMDYVWKLKVERLQEEYVIALMPC
jgi:hypothetical protein